MELTDNGKLINKNPRGQDSYYIVHTDVSDTPKTPDPLIVAIPLDTPYVTPNTDADNTNFSTELRQIKTDLMALKSVV